MRGARAEARGVRVATARDEEWHMPAAYSTALFLLRAVAPVDGYYV